MQIFMRAHLSVRKISIWYTADLGSQLTQYLQNSFLFNKFHIENNDHQVIGTKVTKRAVENDLPQGSFGYSEYSQVFESETTSSVPKVQGFLFELALVLTKKKS